MINSDSKSQKEIDKTENKETAAIRDGNHLIELYNHAPIGIVECSLDGKYINVNEEFCRIIGHEREELLRLDIHGMTIM